jgi:hypothetical protein
MGRVEEIYNRILANNHGEIPVDLTIGDLKKMDDLQIFEWEEYERVQERTRLQRVKLSNPREIAKVAKVEKFWEEELRRGQQRRIIKKQLNN